MCWSGDLISLSGVRSGIDLLYSVSYLWYSSIGAATVIIVGLIVSFITGTSKLHHPRATLTVSSVLFFGSNAYGWGVPHAPQVLFWLSALLFRAYECMDVVDRKHLWPLFDRLQCFAVQVSEYARGRPHVARPFDCFLFALQGLWIWMR